MSHTCLNYHIVFATKQRRQLLSDTLMPRLVKYLGGIIRDQDGSLAEANGIGDHVHIAAALPPPRAIADILREVKAGSSAWMHRDFPDMRDFAWQEGYSAFTVSQSGMPDVSDYIRRQKEHHAKRTFLEELELLLKRHGLQYDPRYL